MKDLRGKVAVITGAASGFGREFARLCADAGMKLTLVDIEEAGLAETGAMLGDAEWIAERCDVSKADQVEGVAQRTYQRFGAAHLLFNNAGVAFGGPIWATTPNDWEWVMGINIMGVVHGIRAFVPRMLEQKDECHVVNTASAAGMVSVPGSSIYCVSKHGVVTLSECLHHELRLAGASINVSVLCPAFVNTRIGESSRNRPAELSDANPEARQYESRTKKALTSGKLSAADVARITLDAVRENRFYIFTHPKIKQTIEVRMRDILDERAPTNTVPS